MRKITVNPFWFGVLMTIVVEMLLLIVIAVIGFNRDERNERERNGRK